jgi:hypothetical protein
MKMMTETRGLRHLLLALALAVFLSGCVATKPKSLYHWGSYEAQVYAHLQGESREAQIEAMERDIDKIDASDKIAPPGFYAHLGLLYAETGHDDKAISCFEKEKARFSESAVFMDFLLNKYRRQP